MRKTSRLRDNKIIFMIILVSLVIISIFGLYVMDEHTGRITSMLNATAGYIYEIVIDATRTTYIWSGYTGSVFENPFLGTSIYTINANSSQIFEQNFEFGCYGLSGPDFYFSPVHPSNLSINNTVAATAEEVDKYFFDNRSYLPDSANKTFKSPINIRWGNRTIYGNGTSTLSWTGPLTPPKPSYQMIPLKDNSSGHIFFGVNANYSAYTYNGTLANYQVMLPTNLSAGSRTYYVFNDPNDICDRFIGIVYGCINDSVTKDPLDNVTVYLGGQKWYTDANGCYSANVSFGEHIIVGTEPQHYVYFDEITVGNVPLEYNFEMDPLLDAIGPDVYVSGFVYDLRDDSPIWNVSVYIGPGVGFTNEDGVYTTRTELGTYYLIGLKIGYEPYIDKIILNSSSIFWDNNTRRYSYNFGMKYIEPEPARILIINLTEDLELPTGVEWFITLTDLKRKIKENTFLDEVSSFYNFEPEPLSLHFGIEGEDMEEILTLENDQLIVFQNRKADLGIQILGIKPPGVYRGNITVTGDLTVKIPVEITIVEEDEIPINGLVLEIDPEDKTAYIGRNLQYRVTLKNLLVDRLYNVSLNYFLKNIKTNETIYIGSEIEEVFTFKSFLRDSKINSTIESGNYLLGVEARYGDYLTTAVSLIRIRIPFLLYKILGFLPVWVVLLLLFLTVMGYGLYLIIHRKLEKKKRFHVKVDNKAIPSEGPRSVRVGHIAETRRDAFVDIDKLTTHSIIAGSTGGGKSIAAQDIIEEALMKNVAVVVFDPTAQWTGMLRKCIDEKMLKLYPDFGLKPTDAKAFKGNIKDIRNSREVINLMRYAKPGEIQIFTTNRLDPKDYDIFISNTVREIFHANLQESRELKILLVYDEIHRILPKFGGSSEGFIQIERACREFRKWGIGVVLISQVMGDLVGEIKANINTQIQMKTRDENDLERLKLNYSEEYVHALIKSPVGSGMITNASWNNGTPYFITFRPVLHSVQRLSDDEIDQYNKYNIIIEDLEYQFEQLEELDQDIFDLKVELRLALEKIKSGGFNMVKIYLESIEPRAKAIWDKIGKTPKRKETYVIDDATLREELEKARLARQKYQTENEGEQPAQPAEPAQSTPTANPT